MCVRYILSNYVCLILSSKKALKRAVKLKQTVYLCNRNKTIINQVRVGLHGGFSVLSSNGY